MSMVATTAGWEAEARRQARSVQTILLALTSSLHAANADQDVIDRLAEPYQQRVEDLFTRDLVLGRAVDSSDLLLHIQGPALGDSVPRVGLVLRMLSGVRSGYAGLTKLLGSLSQRQLPRSLDLGLTAVAPGSLYLGFSLAEEPEAEQQRLPGMPSSLDAAREALRSIEVVAATVSDGGDLDAISQSISDPGVRDAAVLAVEQIAPSGHGIDSVAVNTSPGLSGTRQSSRLTTKSRGSLSAMATNPLRGEAHGHYSGVIRAIDLDRRRFQLRLGEPPAFELDLRCVYAAEWAPRMQSALNRPISVTGRVEYAKDGRPRLLLIDGITLDGEMPVAAQAELPLGDDA